MDLASLWDAVRDRATGDTGSGGLFASSALITGFYNTIAPESGTLPYVIYSTASATATNAFTADVVQVDVRMQVYTKKFPGDGSDPMQVGSNILGRLYGNWVGSSPEVDPTYGFHRWPASLSGSWTASAFQFIDVQENHDQHAYCWIQTYRTYLSK
jgi:hypothetical protein